MKWRVALALATLLTAGAVSAKSITAESFVDLEADDYSALGLSVTVRKLPGTDSPNDFLLTVAAPEAAPLNLAIRDHAFETVLPKLGFGRLDRNGTPALIVQSFTGGAHCCLHLQAVTLSSGKQQIVDLGLWDGDFIDEWPNDLNGDGRRDIVRYDNSFLYAFAPYAMSYAPPVILNIIDGKLVDVSANRSFAKVFADAIPDARSECLEGGRGGCAAYVASAARVGRFKEAWAEMLRHYDRNSEWGLPDGCDTGFYEDKCENGGRRFKSYPDALSAFLKEHGYLPR